MKEINEKLIAVSEYSKEILEKLRSHSNFDSYGLPKALLRFIDDLKIITGSLIMHDGDKLIVKKLKQLTNSIETISISSDTDATLRLWKNLEEILEELTKNDLEEILGMNFVCIKPGSFTMGSPETEPERDEYENLHEVKITKCYYIQNTPVTKKQWQMVMGTNLSKFENCANEYPVESVSWNESQRFITSA